MSTRTDLVETYFEGFRRQDHAMILDCLTDDVTWYLPGHATLEGKQAFDGEIANPAFQGAPELRIDRLVEDGDTVVAIGEGDAHLAGGAPFRFAYCDAFVFDGDRIGRVESYVVAVSSNPLNP